MTINNLGLTESIFMKNWILFNITDDEQSMAFVIGGLVLIIISLLFRLNNKKK